MKGIGYCNIHRNFQAHNTNIFELGVETKLSPSGNYPIPLTLKKQTNKQIIQQVQIVKYILTTPPPKTNKQTNKHTKDSSCPDPNRQVHRNPNLTAKFPFSAFCVHVQVRVSNLD